MIQPGYRRLTGLLLLWAIAPMPFLDVILAPFWLVAAAVALLLVRRPQWAPVPPNWLLNLLAVAIVALVVLVGGWRFGPIRPLAHLLLLVTAVRVLTVVGRKSFLSALQAVFLVWVAAVASSTHVALAPYLFASVVVWWWTAMRVHLLGLGCDGASAPEVAVSWRHVAAAAVLVVLVAVPIFVVLPRLSSPWVAGESSRRASGFSTRVELARGGAIAESRELALVLSTPPGTSVDESWTRLRATGFNMVFAGSWVPTAVLGEAERSGELVWVDPANRDLDGSVELELEVLKPAGFLFVPEGAVAVRTGLRVERDAAGGLVLPEAVEGALGYAVLARPEPVRDLRPPAARDLYLPKDDGGVRALATRLGRDLEAPRQRAEAVADHLRSSYRYSLDVRPRNRVDPVAWFLLDGRAGHCEFFAGAMVVLLRQLDVPARMVGGYSGGTLSPDGRRVMVREANAHSWVEAWLGPDEGWVSFDPTPGEGVPALEEQTGLERLRWAWQRIEDSWDRYVLTFGTGEQVGLLTAAGELGRWLAAAMAGHSGWVIGLLAVLAALPLAVRLVRSRRAMARRPPAVRVLDRLERDLARGGVAIPRAATARRVGRELGARWPAAAAAAAELVALAEAELYGPPGAAGERARARRLGRTVATAMRAAGDGGRGRR